MCETIQIAVNSVINWSFFYYISYDEHFWRVFMPHSVVVTWLNSEHTWLFGSFTNIDDEMTVKSKCIHQTSSFSTKQEHQRYNDVRLTISRHGKQWQTCGTRLGVVVCTCNEVSTQPVSNLKQQSTSHLLRTNGVHLSATNAWVQNPGPIREALLLLSTVIKTCCISISTKRCTTDLVDTLGGNMYTIQLHSITSTTAISVNIVTVKLQKSYTVGRLIEHGLTSAPTQYRLNGRQFLQVWWPNQQCQSTEGRWLVIQTGLSLTRFTSPWACCLGPRKIYMEILSYSIINMVCRSMLPFSTICTICCCCCCYCLAVASALCDHGWQHAARGLQVEGSYLSGVDRDRSICYGDDLGGVATDCLVVGRPSNRLMWQLSALWAGTLSGSLATWPKRALCRWLMVSEMYGRPVVVEMSSFWMNWCQLICSSCLWHFIWKASRALESVERRDQVSAAYNNTNCTRAW